MNPITRFISSLSPKAGAERLRNELAIKILDEAVRKYEGASRTSRTKNWFAPSSSANAENDLSINTLRNRSRDLVRNNPYAARGIQAIAANVVGTGILGTPKYKTGKRSNDSLKALWKDWAESTACDIYGKSNLYQIQAQVMRAVAESGEALVIRRFVNDGKSKIPLKLQVLEGDYIDTQVSNLNFKEPGASTHYGIEVDANGKPAFYHLYKQHPGDSFSMLESRKVPASEVIHIFRADRPGQLRGVPWLAPVMIRIRDFDEFQDAELLRQKIAACLAVFVSDREGVGTPTNSAEREDYGRIQPGTIEFLGAGKEVHFANPPAKEGFKEFSNEILHGIAAGLGITYEVLTGDLSGVSFSSGRMGWLEFHRNIETWQWNLLVPGFCEPAFNWFIDAAKIAGEIPMSARIGAEWTAPRREMIDPDKETRGLLAAMKSGLKSWPDTVRELGYDPDEVAAQIKESLAKMKEIGFIAEWDLNHNVNRSAQNQPEEKEKPEEAEE